MGTAYLIVNVRTAEDVLPISGAQVNIKDKNGKILHTLYTDANGQTEQVSFEAPDKSLTLIRGYEGNPYATCDVEVTKEHFATVTIHDVCLVDENVSILPVDMHPLPSSIAVSSEDYYITPVLAQMPTEPQNLVGINPLALRAVFIPDYITVHLGTPANTAARNVRIKFTDYIKNVASSEIYPTWPSNSIIANIHVITTFALNRIYTEWYRSRGFNFDITNSTAYDQYFVEGRNIYQNISQLVDTVFNVYARRYGFINPFFTQYCNGTTSTCNGLSQWGTVDLANRGYAPLQILRYYYPNDIELVSTENIASITESYPGYALSQGNSGQDVRRIQTFLNRIRVNYPLIPQIIPLDGIFGAQTSAAVRTFQRTFNLTPDGIVGRATWNKITSVYVATVKLGELNSEGIRIGISRTPPTAMLSLNSRGENVNTLQFIIDAIAPYYSAIPWVNKDGFFGNETQNAVMEFQNAFGLTPDGIVGPATWNALYSVYWGIQDNAPVSPNEPPTTPTNPPFPGTLLRLNSRGEDVRTMQVHLNRIRKAYPHIPQLIADGVFGPNTHMAVINFQNEFALAADGIVGKITWDKIIEISQLVTGDASIDTDFGGQILSIGSVGSAVRLMQTFLNELRTVYPQIPLANVDGLFGPRTREAVVAFQNLFGLTPDGIIGENTWNAIVYRRSQM